MSITQKRPKILVILGPTASGKSDLAVTFARKFNGEVISADSRQVYKGLNIGSGKITKKEMQGIPHHLLDVASPKRILTVAHYQKLAKKAIHDIMRRGKLPIICGGTGLYIDALIYEYEFPKVKPNRKLRDTLEKLSPEVLYKKLRSIDPRRAENIDTHNKRRLIRALEIGYALGEVPPLFKKSRYDVLKIGVSLPSNILKLRIKKRLRARLKQGSPSLKLRRVNMIQEVQNLLTSGISPKRLDALGLEYRYISRYLLGLISKQEMIKTLEREIWHYAKRQITWFKKDASIHWCASRKEALRITENLFSFL